MLSFQIDKPNSSKLFQNYFDDLCDTIGTIANFDWTIYKIFTQSVYNDINRTAGYSTYRKGRRVVDKLLRQIQSSQSIADVSSFCSDIPKDIKKEESFVDNIMTVQNSIKSYDTLSGHILQNPPIIYTFISLGLYKCILVFQQ